MLICYIFLNILCHWCKQRINIGRKVAEIIPASYCKFRFNWRICWIIDVLQEADFSTSQQDAGSGKIYCAVSSYCIRIKKKPSRADSTYYSPALVCFLGRCSRSRRRRCRGAMFHSQPPLCFAASCQDLETVRKQLRSLLFEQTHTSGRTRRWDPGPRGSFTPQRAVSQTLQQHSERTTAGFLLQL